MRKKIIEIIGFGMYPERAEAMADEILKLFDLYDKKTSIGCGTCKYKKLDMCIEPCAICTGYYSKYEQNEKN
jgi:hypothetical protein